MSEAPDEAERHRIIAADDARVEAMRRRDIALLSDLLSDALVYTHSSGTIHDKAGFLEAVNGGRTIYLSARRTVMDLHLHGSARDVAVMHGRYVFDIRTAAGDRVLDVLFQSVWVLKDDKWRLASWASTLPPSHPHPAKS